MSGRAAGLSELSDTPWVEIACEDAQRLTVCDGDMLEVESRRGTIRAQARIVQGMMPGVIFVPFHFAEAAANALTSGAQVDPQSKIPGLKATPVSVRPVAGPQSAGS